MRPCEPRPSHAPRAGFALGVGLLQQNVRIEVSMMPSISKLLFVTTIVAALCACDEGFKPSDPHYVLRVLAPAGTAYTVDLRNENGAGGSWSGLGTGVMKDAGSGAPGLTGTMALSGSFGGGPFEVGIASRNGAPGVESGSYQILSGPAAVISPCSIAYNVGAGPQQFRAQFRSTSNPGSICLTP